MAGREIDIRIVEVDAVSYSADVLVLKHAQDLWGLDKRVVARVGVAFERLPEPAETRTVRDVRGIAAQALIFVGTRSIDEFSYQDVRQFGYRALRAAALDFGHASEVAVTLHGVGFGLDEFECFDAEIGGMLEAIELGEIPPGLDRISILELDAARADRLRERLAFLLEPRRLGRPHARSRELPQERTLRTAGSDQARAHAFVAMPFDKSFSDCFDYGISNAVRANGLLCERIDQQTFTGDVMERLKRQIVSARLVIADITGANANVFLEVGYAWGVGKPTVLICRKGSPVPFDVQGHRCLYYDLISELEATLDSELQGLLANL